jgi:uncharacterized phage protein gp47/JayE
METNLMATFSRPTFSEILERIKADIDSRLDGADSRLRRSVLSVLAYAMAGIAHGLYGFISWIALQVFPDTAELEFLNRWAAIWGVTRIPATKASGNVTATGVNGTVIVIGTEFSRSDEVTFVSTAEATIASGTATIPVEASIAEENGNTDAAVELEFSSPISDVDSTVTVTGSGLTGGADEESDDSLEARLLDRIQQPPHGGNENDYLQWMSEITGVTRSWVYPLEGGVNSVVVRFMMDNTYVDGIPLAGDVTTADAYIEARRPITADTSVLAPVAVPLNFTIHLNVSDTSAIRLAVQANLQDLITRETEPGGTLYLSRINEAISLATGEFDHTLAAPVANVTNTTGNITTMGTITWT